LANLGVEFEVVDPAVDELESGEPRELVAENARRKALAGREAAGPGSLVIGCDTEVFLDGAVQGKPAGAEAARAQLRALAGREHEVLSGLCLLGPGAGQERAGVARSLVRLRALNDAEVDRYVAAGEWRDKSGGYAIQGLASAFVERVEGDVSNVVGLPAGLLWELAPELIGEA
jgi:septum formation protein